MSNVVPFRPRSEVRRAIPVIRTAPPEYSLQEAVPLTVEAGTKLDALMSALAAAGFQLAYDQRTDCFLIRRQP